jgi:cell filamentation protein
MSSIRWRWEERDFGFRFKKGQGLRASEYYQGAKSGEFYTVPQNHRKLAATRVKELAGSAPVPPSFNVVSNPWKNYHRDWDWIEAQDGICFNYAGCLDRQEIDRREDEGVGRALEYLAELVHRPEPVRLTLALLNRMHTELMGAIYPFAGMYRTINLTKGDGPTKWPYPIGGLGSVLSVFERDVLGRSPFLSVIDDDVYEYVSEFMNELLAIHPFREGNGRTAFMFGNLVLLQNGYMPLNVYDRKLDQDRYFTACESGRLHKDYKPLAALIAEWQEQAISRWEAEYGK